MEISFGGDKELHHHLTVCDKNPGHEQFIPVEQFTLDSLPARYQDNDRIDFIGALANLTVRVSVTYVSDKRPKTYPGTKDPYPCYTDQDGGFMRTGSGWVYLVKKFSQKKISKSGSKSADLFRRFSHKKRVKKFKTSTCKECRTSGFPKTEFAHIILKTANHVVFDALEGAHTTCHLFFDKGDRPDQCEDAVTLTGMSDVVSDIESDTCQMTYVTHDMDLANRLEDTCTRRGSLLEILRQKYNNSLPIKEAISDPAAARAHSQHSLTIIVSHPHGCSKRVSLGHYTSRQMVKTIWSRYTYSTPTCPGTSGALVFVLGSCLLLFDHAHSGNCEGNKNLNFSGFGLD